MGSCRMAQAVTAGPEDLQTQESWVRYGAGTAVLQPGGKGMPCPLAREYQA